jgi:NitT/TauT family transport system substrate-binding protein
VSEVAARRVRSIALGTVIGVVLGLGLVVNASAGASVRRQRDATTVRLGYFDNVTHAPALVGLEEGFFEDALGSDVKLESSIFNAGPAAVTALLSDSIDATYIGPNPTVSAFQQSDGAVQVISGAASGGAYLVVKPDIKSAKDLKGTTIASPQLGNTQDVALRSWLKKKGLSTDTAGGGDVSILPQENAVTLQAFQDDQIQGAWVPEPWATRLVDEGGGKVLVDERKLWPGGKYVTTDLLVRKAFLDDNPDIVHKLLEGHVAAVAFINDSTTRSQAEADVAKRIEDDTAKPIAPELVTASFDNIVFTNDPIASSLVKSAKAAAALGLPGAVALTKADVNDLYSLELLNRVLKEQHQPAVSATAT